MKKFAKLIPVALGLLTLASCSNDDFFNDGANTFDTSKLGEGDLLVTEAALDESDGGIFTRSWRSDSGDPLIRKWSSKDYMTVYDKDLHKYDIYGFQGGDGEKGAFRLKTGRTVGGNFVSNISEPEYAIYPKSSCIQGHWEYNEKSGLTKTEALIPIPEMIQYDATHAEDGTPVYEDVIPRWGTVTRTDQGYLETNLNYMTGVLRLRLIGTPDYAQYIKVQMIDHQTGLPIQMTGMFKTTLGKNEVPNLNAVLAPEFTTRTGGVNEDAFLHYASVYNPEGEGSWDYEPWSEDALTPDPIPVDESRLPFPFASPFEGAGEDCPETGYAIYVKMNQPSMDVEDQAELLRRSVVFVPLVTTAGRTVDIVASAMYYKDGEVYEKPFMRLKDKVIEAGKLYGNATPYNLAVDGYDPTSINEALETAEPEDGIILLETMNPIGVCGDAEGMDNTILIPNKENTNMIVIDMSKGLYGCESNQTLFVKYKDNNKPFEGDVVLITKNIMCSTPGDTPSAYPVNITTLTSKSGIGIAGTQFRNLKIDGDAFFVGDGKTATLVRYRPAGSGPSIGSDYPTSLLLSDNVKEIHVYQHAVLDYGFTSSYKYKLAIPDATQEEGYQNKGIEKITVNGGFCADEIDARTKAVKIETSGTTTGLATLFTGARTQGQIEINDKSIFLTNDKGIAAWGGTENQPGVKVSGQAYVFGPIFSKTGDIDINIQDLNQTWDGTGRLLSDVIYSLDDESSLGSCFDFYTSLAEAWGGVIGEGTTATSPDLAWGPFYAEAASVKFYAQNSGIVNINGAPIATRANASAMAEQLGLSEHPEKTLPFGVYAKKNIDIQTKDAPEDYKKTKIFVDQEMWAENDGTLAGNVKFGKGLEQGEGGVFAVDNDFTILGVSRVYTRVKVGHDANINLDANDGDCQAVKILRFVKNSQPNKLNLTQGYVRTVKNGLKEPTAEYKDAAFDVELWHAEGGKFAAIGEVTSPDNLIPQNTSTWNGEQMPKELKDTYINYDDSNGDLWTATQLAAQITGTTAPEIDGSQVATLRSNIDLQNYPWAGINTGGIYYFVGFDSQKSISGLNIVGDGKANKHVLDNIEDLCEDMFPDIYIQDQDANVPDKFVSAGFINTAGTLVVKNLKVTAQTSIEDTDDQIFGVGAIAGYVRSEFHAYNVNVELVGGSFGATPTTNTKAVRIGGLAGYVYGNKIVVKGVDVNGKRAIVTGWGGLGGLFGGVNGDDLEATISNAKNTSEYGAMTTKVSDLTLRVTNLEVDDPIDENDLEQGKTGLYIGTIDNLTDIEKLTIEDGIGNTVADQPTIVNSDYETTYLKRAFWTAEQLTSGAWDYKRVFKYTDDYGEHEINSQYLIGQSGAWNPSANAVRIKGKSYNVLKVEDQVPALQTGVLYFITRHTAF